MKLGLIPAAGKSTRMGRPKLLLPLGGQTVLERTLACLLSAGLDQVLVAVRPHSAELKTVAERAGASVLILRAETTEMMATVQQGIGWLESNFRPAPDDLLVVTPGDHPFTTQETLISLFNALEEDPSYTIAVPVFAGKRGHPLVLRWQHATAIRALPEGTGINRYVRTQGAALLEVPVDCADVVRDLNTPADYADLLRTWKDCSR